MPRAQKTRWMPALLGLAAVSIWGYNGFRIAEAMWPAASERIVVATPADSAAPAVSIPVDSLPIYRGDFRDPFEDDRWLLRPSSHPDSAPMVDLAGYRLRGIIGATVIIQSPDDSTHVASAGGALGTLRILSVHGDQVVLRRARATQRLYLNDMSRPQEPR
ncbi:MAG: hypothetical protein R2834_16875 [Rhodothermales bacterium]